MLDNHRPKDTGFSVGYSQLGQVTGVQVIVDGKPIRKEIDSFIDLLSSGGYKR